MVLKSAIPNHPLPETVTVTIHFFGHTRPHQPFSQFWSRHVSHPIPGASTVSLPEFLIVLREVASSLHLEDDIRPQQVGVYFSFGGDVQLQQGGGASTLHPLWVPNAVAMLNLIDVAGNQKLAAYLEWAKVLKCHVFVNMDFLHLLRAWGVAADGTAEPAIVPDTNHDTVTPPPEAPVVGLAGVGAVGSLDEAAAADRGDVPTAIASADAGGGSSSHSCTNAAQTAEGDVRPSQSVATNCESSASAINMGPEDNTSTLLDTRPMLERKSELAGPEFESSSSGTAKGASSMMEGEGSVEKGNNGGTKSAEGRQTALGIEQMLVREGE